MTHPLSHKGKGGLAEGEVGMGLSGAMGKGKPHDEPSGGQRTSMR